MSAVTVPEVTLPSFSRLARLAGPIVFAQMAFFGMNTTDTIVAGRLGPEVLAGVALGGTMLMVGMTLLIGFGLAVSPGVAHRVGAQSDSGEIARFSASALALMVTLWSLWGLLLWLFPPLLLSWLPLEPVVRSEAIAYLRALSLGTPFLGVFFALRNTLEGLGYSRPVMWIGFSALLLNIPLDMALMTGWGPLPALGAMGCGLATALVQCWLAAAMLWLFWRDPRFLAFRPQGRPQRAAIVEILHQGFPIGAALASETALFAAGGLVMTRFGTATIGASQIALNFTGMMFMIALGLGQAVAVLVGQAAGARQAAAVRRIGALGYQSMCVLSGGLALILLLLPQPIVRLYSDDPEVIAIAVSFLKIAGAFHLVDALQALGSGVLRGLKDTAFVMRATTFAYWGVGGLGFVWMFQVQQAGPQAVWWVYCAALATAAALLGLRFWWQARRLPTIYQEKSA